MIIRKWQRENKELAEASVNSVSDGCIYDRMVLLWLTMDHKEFDIGQL